MAIVVLAAVGYGLFSWLGNDAEDAAEAMNVGATNSELLPAGSSPSSNSVDGTAGSTGEGTAGGITSASSLSATTTTARANLAPQELTVKTNPEITNLEITLQDGTVLTGKTPFSYEVPGGDDQAALPEEGLQHDHPGADPGPAPLPQGVARPQGTPATRA